MASLFVRQRRIWIWSAVLVALLVLFFRALERRAIQPVLVTLQGETMGSTWHVRLGDWPGALDDQALKQKLEREIGNRLAEITASMSAWEPGSVLSAFNRAPAESLVVMDRDFQRVLEAALQWNRASLGAYDPTVGPLVRVWGFGPDGQAGNPSPEAVDAARDLVGVQHLATGVIQQGEVALAKHRDGMELDVNGIAPGYAADVISRLLQDRGARNFGGDRRRSGSQGSAARGRPLADRGGSPA
jgi:thiamine biosynthesis lipoprotein